MEILSGMIVFGLFLQNITREGMRLTASSS